MLKKILDKLFRLSERILTEMAQRDVPDRFKKEILLGVGLIRSAQGLGKEARAYFNYIISVVSNRLPARKSPVIPKKLPCPAIEESFSLLIGLKRFLLEDSSK